MNFHVFVPVFLLIFSQALLWVMRLGTEDALKATLQGLGFSGRLNTAFVERVNLTVRHGVAALARRTWATAQQSPQLLAHLEWWRAYYHFVRPHRALRVALVQPRVRGDNLLAQRYRQRTPAMAAGRTHRRWTAVERPLFLPHCLTEESYFDSRGCLMGNLTFLGVF